MKVLAPSALKLETVCSSATLVSTTNSHGVTTHKTHIERQQNTQPASNAHRLWLAPNLHALVMIHSLYPSVLPTFIKLCLFSKRMCKKWSLQCSSKLWRVQKFWPPDLESAYHNECKKLFFVFLLGLCYYFCAFIMMPKRQWYLVPHL
jgi:hypothetical protein